MTKERRAICLTLQSGDPVERTIHNSIIYIATGPLYRSARIARFRIAQFDSLRALYTVMDGVGVHNLT